MEYSNLSNIDFFGYIQTSTEMVNGKRGFEITIKNEYEHYTKFCGPCVGASENKNLSNAQKELLLWNCKWGISMYRIQEMTNPQQVLEPDGAISVMAPVISPKLATAETCAVPACEYFLLGISKKRSPGVAKVNHVPYKEGILARDKYEVGYLVSTDKSVVRTTVRLSTGYGRECRHNLFRGGTICNDAAYGLIWFENKVSLRSNETFLGNRDLNNGCGNKQVLRSMNTIVKWCVFGKLIPHPL